MSDRIGQQFGQYRLLRLLGQGGFAEVYLGEHVYLGTLAAIKVLHTQVDEEDIGEFQQEARMLANLKHPHIVRVLDFGVDGRTPYLVMDYAPGGTLRGRHPKGTRLPLSIVIDYVKQLAQALQYAHERKVIHRDIKPENMLIGENAEILLSDFGIALIAQSSRYQSTKDMAGTIAYMAPEQIEAHPRPASDQYSLAIVVYEWLSGNRPFHGSFTEIAIKHSVTPPPPLHSILPALSPEVEQVILTALAKKPEERFATIRAFAHALEQACVELPTERSRPLNAASSPHAPQPIPDIPAAPLIHTATNTGSSTALPMQQVRPAETLPALPDQIRLAPATLAIETKPTKQVSRRALIIGTGVVVAATAVGGTFAIVRSSTSVHSLPIGKRIFTCIGHSDQVWAVAWSPDGKRIVSASLDKTVQVWNATDGSHVFTYTGHSGQVGAVAWSPDGERIVSASWDKTVQVWNATDGSHVFTCTGHSDFVWAVAWSPDSKQIASASWDKTVQVWNATDGSHVFTYTGHSGPVYAVAWSSDSRRIASSSGDKTVRVWNATDGTRALIYTGHSDQVGAVAWSPDRKQIVSGSDDKTAQVWNAADGSHVFTYTGHSDFVWAVAWSLDSKQIASGSKDRTVQVWKATGGSNTFTYTGHSDVVNAVVWSPDGTRIASGSFDKTVQVWGSGTAGG